MDPLNVYLNYDIILLLPDGNTFGWYNGGMNLHLGGLEGYSGGNSILFQWKLYICVYLNLYENLKIKG
jgi:hypothetical protein